MHWLSLKYFLAVADTLSFSEAAQTLHVSHPALSHHVRMLEEILEVQLLNRTTRNMELTGAFSAQRKKLFNF